MRISDIDRWVNCEVEALHGTRERGSLTAALVVGLKAHAMLAGESGYQISAQHEGLVAWDDVTPTSFSASRQAMAISEAARLTLSEQGWVIRDLEGVVEGPEPNGDRGRYDIIASHASFGLAVVDLKTGQGIGAAWLQVGGYLEEARNQGLALDCGGVLHVPRLKLGRDVGATLDVRPEKPLRSAWIAWRQRREVVVGAGSLPLARPGQHCRRCSLTDCPVRLGNA